MSRCKNGHTYDGTKNKECPFCAMQESMHTRYMVNTEDEEAHTVRFDMDEAEFESEVAVENAKYESAGKTVRNIQLEESSHTVRLSDAQSTGQRERQSLGIDPVEVVKSEPMELNFIDREQNRQECFLEPVGWMVCVEGGNFGESYALHAGKNSIGRSSQMDVSLKKDQAVSRVNHAWIVYHEPERTFEVEMGEKHKMMYLNEEILFHKAVMKRGDILYLGDSGLMLIPCCDENFSWEMIKQR